MPSDNTRSCQMCDGKGTRFIWPPLPVIDEAYERNPVERESPPAQLVPCDRCGGTGRIGATNAG